MIKIHFYPDSDLVDYSPAIAEYEKIWTEDGKRIVEAYRSLTGFDFSESFVNAIVSDLRSHSHPLNLKYSIPFERKKTVLVHELGHRLVYKRMRVPKGEDKSLFVHKHLFLILHEIFSLLYGNDVADSAVEWDKQLPQPEYKVAWEWALAIPKEERLEKFFEMMRQNPSL